MKTLATFGAICAALLCVVAAVWLAGSKNPDTDAGYVGYVTRGAVFGQMKFHSLQTGPTSPGRGWLLRAVNVSVTPYTYTEHFSGADSVLARDNLHVEFQLSVVWKVRHESVKEFVEKFSTIKPGIAGDALVKESFDNYLKQPMRTYARQEAEALIGMEIKDHVREIGDTVSERLHKLSENTPFEIISVVVGNVQYPTEVSSAVAKKIAATQELERMATEVQIEEQRKQKRVTEAEGIAKAMEIVQAKLTPQYLQHEAIEAQKLMVGSPNHTTIYIPTGAMGVPLVGTFDAAQSERK